MSFYKNVNIIRAVSDLKNGIPVSANIKHKLSKNSSKNFYFVRELTHPSIFKKLQNPEFITTKEREKYGKDDIKFEVSEGFEQDILHLVKTAELVPILIRVKELPEDFAKIEIKELKDEEIKDFISEFIYDLKLSARAPVALKNAKRADFFVFETPIFNKQHYVIKIGDPEKDKSPLVRIHSSCYTGDLLASLRCDCRDQLQETIKFIETAEGFNGGYIFYLMQEGRGIGLKNKIEAYRLQQEEGLDTIDSNLAIGYYEEERNFIPAVKMMEVFDIKSVVLITNNPKKAKDLAGLGIDVKKTLHTIFAQNEYNKDYLKIKKTRMLHDFS